MPEDSEVKVGDEIVLKCSASFDPMLDIVFIWAIDLRVIDFNSEWQHYERIMVGEQIFTDQPQLRKKAKKTVLFFSMILLLRVKMAEAT